jgi:predicted acylesterase/phospholipase RssA
MLFKSLALGGGGVRGGLHIGALAALEKFKGNLDFPEGIYGTSVGSIVATAVAFGLKSSQIREMFDKHFHMESILPPIRLSNLVDSPTKKGLFSMDMLEKTVLEAFDSQGVDLRGKKIADAEQRLYIVASNMTTMRTNILTCGIPVLDAIKCSSCLPFVFVPQVLYNQVYVDGGVFMDSLVSVVPETCLVIHISSAGEPMYPSEMESMSLAKFLHSVYRGTRNRVSGKNVLWLQNESVHILQSIGPKEKALLYNEGFSQTRTFLTKRFPEELK